jgi:hypothetical protein
MIYTILILVLVSMAGVKKSEDINTGPKYVKIGRKYTFRYLLGEYSG